MQFQIGSIINLVSDVEKIVSLFLTYEGQTHSVEFKQDAVSSPEAIKDTLISAVTSLADAAINAKVSK